MGAPGERILSTNLADEFDIISGTSASAPHVAGVIALLHSIECPKLSDLIETDNVASALLIKDAILDGVSPNPTLSQTLSGGRLDAFRSFLNMGQWCSDIPLTDLEIVEVRASTADVSVSFQTDVLTMHQLDIFNASGRLVYKENFLPNIFGNFNVVANLSLASLPPAVYYIQTVSYTHLTLPTILLV